MLRAIIHPGNPTLLNHLQQTGEQRWRNLPKETQFGFQPASVPWFAAIGGEFASIVIDLTVLRHINYCGV
jgi:hypothetical protein